MPRRVIRATTDLNNRVGPARSPWSMDRSKWIEVTAYRIEWPDGEPTNTGLFASVDWAQRYANGRGWSVDIEDCEREDCA